MLGTPVSQALAAECVPVLKDGWARLPPGPQPMMLAGFGRLENPCKTPASVVAVSSAAFMHASLHGTTQEGGVSRMREIDALPLAPGATATLAPGGLHLMLMHPSAPLKEGEQIAVGFTLADGRAFTAEIPVRKTAP